jgi:hypothetical protein
VKKLFWKNFVTLAYEDSFLIKGQAFAEQKGFFLPHFTNGPFPDAYTCVLITCKAEK